MPVTRTERDALETVANLIHVPLRGKRRNPHSAGDSGIQSNYPRGLAHLADWDIHGRWVQKVVDETRAHLVAAGLMERGEASGWQKEQRAKESRERFVESCEARKLRRRTPRPLRHAYNGPRSVVNPEPRKEAAPVDGRQRF